MAQVMINVNQFREPALESTLPQACIDHALVVCRPILVYIVYHSPHSITLPRVPGLVLKQLSGSGSRHIAQNPVRVFSTIPIDGDFIHFFQLDILGTQAPSQ